MCQAPRTACTKTAAAPAVGHCSIVMSQLCSGVAGLARGTPREGLFWMGPRNCCRRALPFKVVVKSAACSGNTAGKECQRFVRNNCACSLQVIKANDDLTPEHHQFFLYQMLRGLKYIHSGVFCWFWKGPQPQTLAVRKRTYARMGGSGRL